MDLYNQVLRASIEDTKHMLMMVQWFQNHVAHWENRVIRCWVCGHRLNEEWRRKYLDLKACKFFGMNRADLESAVRREYGGDWLGYLIACQKSPGPFKLRFDAWREETWHPPVCRQQTCQRALWGSGYGPLWKRLYETVCPICKKQMYDSNKIWCSTKCKRAFLRKARRSIFTFEVV
jgi:hypothetical protein